MKNLIIKPLQVSSLPSGSIHVGDGEYDILIPDEEIFHVKERLSEFYVDNITGKGTKVFKKTGYKKKTRIEK